MIWWEKPLFLETPTFRQGHDPDFPGACPPTKLFERFVTWIEFFMAFFDGIDCKNVSSW